MSGAIATAYVKLIPTFDKGLKTKIGDELGGADAQSGSKKAGSKVGKLFSRSVEDHMAGMGNAVKTRFSAMSVAVGNIISSTITSLVSAATSSIGNLMSTAFNGFADYQQLEGGIKKLFADESGDAYNIVMRNAERAFETAGMSANEYMENVSGFSAALVNSLGGDTVEAAKRADIAMQAISDNVNTFGTDMQSVQYAFQGFAKQNYTMLDNLKLGYGGTKEEMERLIADANEYAAANGMAADLSIESFADIITAIDLIQQKQHIWGTTSKEAMKTVSGSIGMLRGAWTNLISSFGRDDADWGQLAEDLNVSLAAVFDNVVPMLGNIAVNIIEHVPMIFNELGGAIETSLVPQLETAFENIRGTIDFGDYQPILDEFVEDFEKLSENIGPVLEKLGSVVETAFGASLAVLEKVFEIIANIVEYINHFDEKMDEIAHDETWQDQINQIDDAVYAVETYGDALVDVPNEVTTKINVDDSNAKSKLGNITSLIASMTSTTKWINIGMNVTKDASGGFYRLHASGGFITNGATFLGYDRLGYGHIAGEAGREWIKTHADGTTSILPIENKKYLKPYAQEIASMIGTQPTTVYNVSIDGATVNADPEIRAVFYDLMTTIGRKKAMNVG